MLLPWLLCGAFSILTLLLWAKIRLLCRSMDEICGGLEGFLGEDTNTLLSISSRDRHARRLASELNRQLRTLRNQRRRFQNGDRELKEAVTNISHDLRTPLTAICGYLDLLEREEKSEAAARYLAVIGERTQAMRQLTEELFRYSVILSNGEDLALIPVDLARALEEGVAAFYGALTERGIIPEICLSEKQTVRDLNPAALSRVFSNLLSNALKYSGGDLEITLEDDGEITFANTAPQLDGVQVGRLFHRFFSVEAARSSTGLGLAIAKTLVEQMGGSIEAEYENKRLKVCVRFPERG